MANDHNITSRQLVQRVLDGRPVPRPAVGPLAVHYCAAVAGVSIRDYTLNPEVLADCVIRYYHQFKPDAVWLSADTWVSAQAMGARVDFPGENQPLGGTGEPLIREASDIERLSPPDPTSQGRWPLMLDALRRIRRALGDEVFIVACFDQYPFSLACAVMGIEAAMLAATEDRSMLQALMARCADYAVAYAVALAQGGADLLSGGDSPAALLGPKTYREIALPFEQQVITRVKAATCLPVSLHMCGNAIPILPDLAQCGTDVLELDQRTNLDTACKVIPPHMTIWGNVDPVAILTQGTPKDVEAAANALLRSMATAGRQRFIVSSGCTLTMQTPEPNLHALVLSARSFRDQCSPSQV